MLWRSCRISILHLSVWFQITFPKGNKNHRLQSYTPTNDLHLTGFSTFRLGVEFNLFDYHWPICHHFFSSSCRLPPPFTHAPWCLKYGCCFYIKCCYQSTTWITMNNVSCICLPGVKTRCPTVQGWLLAGGSTCVMINKSDWEPMLIWKEPF